MTLPLTRRRFLSVTAGAASLLPLGFAARAGAPDLYVWRGVALGAEAVIRLPAGPDAKATAMAAAAEIARLERIFSLTRADSSLSRLNSTGRLDAPDPDLLACLTRAGQVHAATGGLFDATVQPLWALYATRGAAGGLPTDAEVAAAQRLTGWDRVRLDEAAVTLAPGMGLTLNGIAQGYIADRVADLLSRAGLTQVLVNTGEYRALGPTPAGNPWSVELAEAKVVVPLANRALATSSPLGTTFDTAGLVGHILDPRTGRPARPRWVEVTVSAPEAAVADALSTAACLMGSQDQIAAALTQFPGARVEAAV